MDPWTDELTKPHIEWFFPTKDFSAEKRRKQALLTRYVGFHANKLINLDKCNMLFEALFENCVHILSKSNSKILVTIIWNRSGSSKLLVTK